jgi:hypothetical protein
MTEKAMTALKKHGLTVESMSGLWVLVVLFSLRHSENA